MTPATLNAVVDEPAPIFTEPECTYCGAEIIGAPFENACGTYCSHACFRDETNDRYDE